jgi:hypothetical protein
MATSANTSRVSAFTLQDHLSKVFSCTATWDAPSAATGGDELDTISCPGVALGDIVLGVSLGVSAAGLAVSAYVSAADVVTVHVANNTGGAVDLASTTVRVLIGRLAS